MTASIFPSLSLFLFFILNFAIHIFLTGQSLLTSFRSSPFNFVLYLQYFSQISSFVLDSCSLMVISKTLFLLIDLIQVVKGVYYALHEKLFDILGVLAVFYK